MRSLNAIWSGGAHLWQHGGSENYSLEVAFDVEPGETGRQRLKAAFTSAFDYGIIELSLGSVKLKGMFFDLQANDAVVTGTHDRGVSDLAEGPHVLRIGMLDTSVIIQDTKDS